MDDQKNYKRIMILLIFLIWVMYMLKWVTTMNVFIPIIMELSIVVLLTLIVGVLNQDYRSKKHNTDRGKKKQLEKDLKKSGFDPEDLKGYLKE